MGVVSAKDVHERIQAFCKMYDRGEFSIIPGYEFAHVVVDDYNLDNECVQYAISQADTWEKEKMLELSRIYHGEPFVLQDAKRVVGQYKDGVIELLRWLLTVPEEVREEAIPHAYGEVE